MGQNNDHRVHVVIKDLDFGVWDKRSGGKTTSQSKIYHPGGGRAVPGIPLGGKKEHEPITCEKGKDTGALPVPLKTLREWCGLGVQVRCTDQEVDAEGNKVGEGETAIGTLTDAWPSDTDSENEDEGMVAFTMNVVTYV